MSEGSDPSMGPGGAIRATRRPGACAPVIPTLSAEAVGLMVVASAGPIAFLSDIFFAAPQSGGQEWSLRQTCHAKVRAAPNHA